MANKGQIGVTTENIFPVIKQFLYSDHEIFLRELVANAVDATQKMKALAASGDYKEELGDLKVGIELDEKAQTLKIVDNGIGMTEEEVDKYINQIAFSSAGEFLEKYKDQIGNIIGHFGLGFYSAFMVSKKVTIETLSWKEGAKAVKWTCDGSPAYEMEEIDKADRGTTKAPSELKDEDYKAFYRTLFPMNEEPLFWIHLNVDYPFNLTGILYFPKLKDRVAVERNKISLYCNQMFVTDHVDNIVPDFMTLLHGVIDSPDIPLNVSRSYLQSDAAVKKISTYITKKVADRLENIFKEERAQLEEKWDNLKLFIEYGMLSDEKFCERALKFALLKNVDGKYFSFDEYKTAVEAQQTDKDKKLVYLYATKPEDQYAYIQAAKDKGYDVLLMDCELDAHYVNLLEQKLTDIRFARVDSDAVENLIPKEDKMKLEMKEDERYDLENLFKAVLPEGPDYFVQGDNLGEDGAPILITQNEFMRRYREMSALGGGMNFYGSMPDSYNLTVNMEHPLIAKIWAAKQADVAPQAELPAEAPSDASDEEKNKAREAREAVRKAHRADVEAFAKDNELLHQLVDLALLGNGMLKGKALSEFIARSQKVLREM